MSKINNVPQYKIVTKLNLIINYNDSSPVGDEDGRLEKGEFSCGIKQPKVNYQGVHVYAFHFQKREKPKCYDGFTKLWDGYSFVGRSDWNFSTAGLSGPGSCLEDFYPLPTMECHKTNCNYTTRDDYAAWLVNTTLAPYTKYHVGLGQNAEPYVSRCVVCEGNKKLFVRHFQRGEGRVPPDRFNLPGWTVVWEGYSIAGPSNYPSSADLSSIGSCLRELIVLPYMECNEYNNCYYGTKGDLVSWLINDKANPKASGNLDREKRSISRCAVYMKE